MRPIHLSPRAVPAPSPDQTRLIPTEFLSELQAAASMIMSREECEELAREIEAMRRPQIVAA